MLLISAQPDSYKHGAETLVLLSILSTPPLSDTALYG